MLKTFLVRERRKVLRINEAVDDDRKLGGACDMYEEKKCIQGFDAKCE
jgi:hypothetical protein